MRQNIAAKAAQELASILNGMEVEGQNIAAEFKLIPEKALSTSKKLSVLVVPHGVTTNLVSRARLHDSEVQLDVGITKRSSLEELEDLLDIVQFIGETIEGAALTCGSCSQVEYLPLYDVDAFLQQSSFFSVIRVKIRVLQ